MQDFGSILRDEDQWLDQWTSFDISQEVLDHKLVFRAIINGTEEMSEENREPKTYQNVKVFAANLWMRALPGYMKDLLISVKVPINKLVPQAAFFKKFLQGATNIELHGADRCIDGVTDEKIIYLRILTIAYPASALLGRKESGFNLCAYPVPLERLGLHVEIAAPNER